MAFSNNKISVVGLLLILILIYCDVNAGCPRDCQCVSTSLICNNYPRSEWPSAIEVRGLVSIQFFNCRYETNLTAIQYENASLLIVDNCDVTSLPEKSFSVTLEQLTLTGNRIRDVHSNAFSGLSRLFNLDMSYNHLRSLPGGVFEPLRALKTIDLTGNDQLVTVDWASLFTTESISLTAFLCNRCGLKQVPVVMFEKVPNLQRLELNRNNFTKTSSPFGKNVYRSLSSLTHLSLEGNYLKEVDQEAFSGQLESLHSLRLGENKIGSLKGTNIQRLQQLQSLALHDNLLVSLSKEDIPQSLLADGVTNSLELSGNPWNCNSDLVWLRSIESKVADSEELRCALPAPMNGQLLYRAPVESFQTSTIYPSSPSTVAVAAIILWTLTTFVVLVLFIRRVYVKRKQRSSPSRYTNVAASQIKVGTGHRV